MTNPILLNSYGATASPGVTPNKEKRLIGVIDTIQEIGSRLAYFLRHPIAAIRPLSVERAIACRTDQVKECCDAYKPINFEYNRAYSLYEADVNDLSVDRRAYDKRYVTFHLATVHETALTTEEHNVTVLLDQDWSMIYLIDGKGQDPKQIFFMKDWAGTRAETSVMTFIDKLRDEIGDEKAPAFCLNRAGQRTMDCVIFPEVLISDLIQGIQQYENAKGISSLLMEKEECGLVIQNVMQKISRARRTFYARINQLRDMMNAEGLRKKLQKPLATSNLCDFPDNDGTGSVASKNSPQDKAERTTPPKSPTLESSWDSIDDNNDDMRSV